MNTYKFLLTSVAILCFKKVVCSNSIPVEINELKIYSKIGSDISPQADHSRFEVRSHESAIEYRIPEGCNITEVKYRDEKVCEVDSIKNPNALYLMSNPLAIALVFGDQWKFYVKGENGWILSEEKIVESITLDINIKSTNDEIVYSISDDTAMYRPINEKLIKTVKQGSNIIFESQDSIEYARKVTLEDINSNDQKLIIELLCGDIKIYKRKNNGPWEEETIEKAPSKSDSNLRGISNKLKKMTEIFNFNTVTIVLIIAGGLLVLVLLGVLVKICIS